MSVDAGTYSLQIDGILPTGNATAIGSIDLTFDDGIPYEILTDYISLAEAGYDVTITTEGSKFRSASRQAGYTVVARATR